MSQGFVQLWRLSWKSCKWYGSNIFFFSLCLHCPGLYKYSFWWRLIANKIGIGGFLKEYAKFDDYAAFARKFAPSAATNNFSFVFTNGGVSSEEAQADTNSGSIEGNLDSQYAFTLGYPAQGIYYSTAGSGPLAPDLEQPDDAHNQNEPFLDFLHYMMSVPDQDLPTVLSISYGENEQSVPASCESAIEKTGCSNF